MLPSSITQLPSPRVTTPYERLLRGSNDLITIPLIRKADGSWAKSDDEKAMAFADHLQQVFTTHHFLNPADAAISAFLDYHAKCPYISNPSLPKKW